MPTIEISHRDLCGLVGRNIPLKKLKEEAILFAKGEVESEDGDVLKVEIKDTNRPDLWSTEGIAREIAGRYGKPGLPEYHVGNSDIVVNVDRKVKGVRPYTVCAVVRNLTMDENTLSQLIQLQEKISTTFGRNRKEVAIGAYDLHRITPPIRFTTVTPTGIKFAPLEFNQKMTPKEILQKHPKGKEYGHLLKGLKEYPLFIDASDEVLSMPPIINSDWTGKITSATRDIFIECSGFDLRFLIPALNATVAALADRGGRIEAVRVVYPDQTLNTPDLRPKTTFLDIDYAQRLSGLNLKPHEICRLLEQARYEAKYHGNRIKLLYPAYRQDIMHQTDVVEDMLISFGYNRIEPEIPKLSTVGSELDIEVFSGTVKELMRGSCYQEILSYILTSKDNLFKKMNLKPEPVVEIENFISSNWCVFRNHLLPCLLEFLSGNKHVEYPQKIFEVGDVVVLDKRSKTRTQDIRKLAVAITSNMTGYEEISSVLDALLSNLGLGYKLRPAFHLSFIKGRTANILVSGKTIGIVGEISPLVLERWGLEKPVVAFEIDLTALQALF